MDSGVAKYAHQGSVQLGYSNNKTHKQETQQSQWLNTKLYFFSYLSPVQVWLIPSIPCTPCGTLGFEFAMLTLTGEE